MIIVCSSCQNGKPFFCFHYRTDNQNYRKQCKTCWTARCSRYYSSNRDKEIQRRKDNYAQNKSRYAAQSASWRAEHPEKMLEYKRKWKKANRGKVNADWMKRAAAKIQATPSWLSEEQVTQIETIYKNCPAGFHVDHIVPLRGKSVRGLHVPWNLQYLPAAENVRKGNRV